ncbi:MAG: hypothetical protein JST55_08015 [Bacteroidetes bacterium]|nr:hypothetical protein [Bacteroidota bacterium]
MNVFTSKKLLAILLPAAIGWLFCFAAFYLFREYGVVLFAIVPTGIGALSSFLISYNSDTEYWESFRTSIFSLLIFLAGIVVFAIEGIICAVMAFPFAAVAVLMGTWIGYIIANSKFLKRKPQIITILIIIIPLLMSLESRLINNEDVFSVTTSVEINSSPEKVWKNVVIFPKLDEPTELLFRTGIAYPINAEIDGNGVGAIRHCNFSTGSFVEPITVWNEPNLLKFSVTNQPDAMKEISPYDIHPDHLHGYFVSKEGQFKLTKLDNGHTLLEGTTWYTNRIKPDFYWTLWSDYIVHKIHTRVLEHIKKQCENN